MSRSSLALNQLRAVIILVVLAFHSVLAYLASAPATTPSFDRPPFQWRSFPIVDGQRFVGFDLFCAWQDVYLMSLFVFLSGLFIWPSLVRKGAKGFLGERLVRLGVPYVVVVGLLMPIAQYPTYLQTADDPGVAAYWRHFLALPFWPNGPAWFLQVLAVAGLAAAALYCCARPFGQAMAVFSASAEQRPARYFSVMLLLALLAYVPLALAFGPWRWAELGPFSVQLSRPLHYAFYFFAGLGVGACGLDRGLLAVDGPLMRHWRAWLVAALASMAAWIAITSQTIGRATPVPFTLDLAVALSFAIACGISCLFVLAACLRFGGRPLGLLDRLKNCAYGIYLVHYVFIVWLQYLLLSAPWPAIAKAAAVFGGTLVLIWSLAAAALRLPYVARTIGSGRLLAPAGARIRAVVQR
jgi:peptidoglycan/LPS O-acetylase OafA/YrhL